MHHDCFICIKLLHRFQTSHIIFQYLLKAQMNSGRVKFRLRWGSDDMAPARRTWSRSISIDTGWGFNSIAKLVSLPWKIAARTASDTVSTASGFSDGIPDVAVGCDLKALVLSVERGDVPVALSIASIAVVSVHPGTFAATWTTGTNGLLSVAGEVLALELSGGGGRWRPRTGRWRSDVMHSLAAPVVILFSIGPIEVVSVDPEKLWFFYSQWKFHPAIFNILSQWWRRPIGRNCVILESDDLAQNGFGPLGRIVEVQAIYARMGRINRICNGYWQVTWAESSILALMRPVIWLVFLFWEMCYYFSTQ